MYKRHSDIKYYFLDITVRKSIYTRVAFKDHRGETREAILRFNHQFQLISWQNCPLCDCDIKYVRMYIFLHPIRHFKNIGNQLQILS